MSPSPDDTKSAGGLTQKGANRARPKATDNLQKRGQNKEHNELGRKDKKSERVTHIYPVEPKKIPAVTGRLPQASPPYSNTASPLISALGTTNSAAQYTSEWTKSLPVFSQGSPSNAFSISGSPPQAIPAHSPSNASARPLSHPNPYTNFGGRLQSSPQLQPIGSRRASMFSQYGHRSPMLGTPPLPHQPQPHFYGIHPSLDEIGGLPMTPDETMIPGEHGYSCGFDSMGTAGHYPSRSAENVLLVGKEGEVAIWRIDRRIMKEIGHLEGLRGSVVGARVLSWTSRDDPCAKLRPLIALTIHGPVTEQAHSSGSDGDTSAEVDKENAEPDSQPGFETTNPSAVQITHYQTTVEIYSLRTTEHVATLFKSPPIALSSPIDSPMFQKPPPVGDLQVESKGKFVVVASGSSGEVFIFSPYLDSNPQHPPIFRCIGKVWTSVQFKDVGSTSSASSSGDTQSHESDKTAQQGNPLFSLSNRWLAVVPPASTALFPLDGTALVSATHKKPPGLDHHTVPTQPPVTCELDIPDPDSLINRMTREGTQAAIKGARWAADKGMQAFKNYMGRSSPGDQSTPVESPNIFQEPSLAPVQHYFPPTHLEIQPASRSSKDQTVISVYDLNKLLSVEETRSRNVLHPLASFTAPQGCSLLSFSPTGLMLMTVSKKGDVQQVWDLMRIKHRQSRRSTRTAISGPHVREIVKFTRMTVANTVDIVWSAPKGQRVAILTDKGTVHMYPMPPSAFQWPPPRRFRKTPPKPVTKDGQEPLEAAGVTSRAGGAVNSAMQAINGTTKPLIDAVRSRGAGNGSKFGSFPNFSMTSIVRAKSGKAVAAGLGKSIVNTTSNIRHASDNKVSLPSIVNVRAGSVRWMTGKGQGCIALIAGGVVQLYRIHIRSAAGKARSGPSIVTSKQKYKPYPLLPFPRRTVSPAISAQLGQSPKPYPIWGEWTPRTLVSNTRRSGPESYAIQAYAEIETNHSYQPFHTDRRTALCGYQKPLSAISDADESNVNPNHVEDDRFWAFGGDIPVVKFNVGITYQTDDGSSDLDHDEDDGHLATALEKNKVQRNGYDEIEQIIVTTRRRRTTKADDFADDDAGFFEDDCDVLDFAEDRV